ncbi:hypothetical protein ACTFIY_008889 [Dictyostelium cf. discoideum]
MVSYVTCYSTNNLYCGALCNCYSTNNLYCDVLVFFSFESLTLTDIEWTIENEGCKVIKSQVKERREQILVIENQKENQDENQKEKQNQSEQQSENKPAPTEGQEKRTIRIPQSHPHLESKGLTTEEKLKEANEIFGFTSPNSDAIKKIRISTINSLKPMELRTSNATFNVFQKVDKNLPQLKL